MDGAAHGAQLVLCLDAARAFGNFLAITIIEARTADRVQPRRLNLVDADLCMARCVAGEQVRDLSSKGIGRRTDPVTAGKVKHIRT